MDLLEMEGIIIRFIAKEQELRLQHFTEKIAKEIQDENFRNPVYINQVLWRLIIKGAVFLDIGGKYRGPADWRIRLTGIGDAIAEGDKLNPNDPFEYSKHIGKKLPNISNIEKIYLTEALQAYDAKLYISAVVMAGVVAEKAYLDLAESFVNWPKCSSGIPVKKELMDPRGLFAAKKNKLLELASQYKEIPEEKLDNIRGIIDGMMDLIRTTRNDAGHPKGVTITQDNAKAILCWLPYALKKIHTLRLFFESGNTNSV